MSAVRFVSICAIVLAMALAGCSQSASFQETLPSARISPSSVLQVDESDFTDEQLEQMRQIVEKQLASQEVKETDVPRALIRARKNNADVIAWLVVPGTNVSLPLAQNQADDDYYMTHGSDGQPCGLGSAFVDSANSSDFDDPVTVVYGHTFSDAEIMFGQLHRFEDPAFFEKHDSFSIYMADGRALSYRVLSTCLFSNVSILDAWDFNNQDILQAYYSFVTHPGSQFSNERDGAEPVAGQDKIVQLETCTNPMLEDARFVITGLLEKEDMPSSSSR